MSVGGADVATDTQQIIQVWLVGLGSVLGRPSVLIFIVVLVHT